VAASPRDCPCRSGLRYPACCAPFHRGESEAPTCEKLMRSRFSAFAIGLGDYLVRTLADEHPDRALPAEALARELGNAHQKQRYQGLTLVFAEDRQRDGEVLFIARIFERGADRSFAELSRFVREKDAWRYASGDALPAARLPADPSSLDRAAFLSLVGESSKSAR
jgi:SEC-C motif-containing protein